MDIHSEHLTHIVSHLAGVATPEQSDAVQSWRRRSPENEQVFRDLERIWTLSSTKVRWPEVSDVDTDWAMLMHRMEEQERPQPFRVSTLFRGRRLHSFPSIALRYAVILIFATMIGGFFVRAQQAEPVVIAEPTLRDIFIPRGQRGNVTLSDGTKVILNAESRITLPTSFGSDSRQVYLEGEAYFDVAKDPSRPFRIMVNGAQVEVVGTRFAIRSISGDLSVQTVVEEGIVALTTDHGDARKKVLVTKGMVARLDLNNKVITTKVTRDLDLYLSWKDGFLKFDRTPLREVADELERKFDVTIRFASDELEDLELTAELKSRTIVNVLDVISTSLGLQARMEQDTVLFSRAGTAGVGQGNDEGNATGTATAPSAGRSAGTD